MKKNTILLYLLLITKFTICQTSLDSLRLVLPVGHTMQVTNAEFHPNKKLLLTVSQDHTVRLWDLKNKKELFCIKLSNSNWDVFESTSIAHFSETGNYIISEIMGKLQVWDTNTGNLISTLENEFDSWWDLGKIKISPNEDYVITSYEMESKKYIFIWNLYTGRLINKVLLSNEEILDYFFQNNSNKINIISKNGEIFCCFSKTGKIENRFQIDLGFSIIQNSLLCENKLLIHTGENNLIFWDLQQNKVVSKFPYYNSSDSEEVFFNNGKIVFTNKLDSSVWMWDFGNNTRKVTKTGLNGIKSAKLASDGNTIIALSKKNTIISWDVNVEKENYKLNFPENLTYGQNEEIESIEISPNSKTFIVKYSHSCKSQLFDLSTGDLIFQNNSNDLNDDCAQPRFSEDGKFCLFAQNNNIISIFNTTINSNEDILYSKSRLIKQTSLSLDGEKELIVFDDNEFSVFDLNNGNEVINSSSEGLSKQYQFSNIGNFLLIFDTLNKLVISKSISHFSKINISDTFRLTSIPQNYDWISKHIINSKIDSALINLYLESIIKSYFDKNNYGVSFSNFSPNKDYFCIKNSLKELLVFNNRNASISFEIISSDNQFENFSFSNDSKKLITGSWAGKSILWDVEHGKKIMDFDVGKSEEIRVNGFFSPANNWIIIANDEDSETDYLTLRFFDYNSGKYLYKIRGENWRIKDAVVSPNDKYLALSTWSNNLIIWNLEKRKLEYDLSGHILSIEYLSFTPDGEFLLTCGHDQIFLWDMKTGKKIYQRFQLENNNWLVKLPNSPYYMCSKEASKMLHYVTPSLKVIGFEQLDPVYNRPDIVLDSIGKYFGNEDRGMINEYRKSWEKRIDRLGLDKEKLGKGEISVPNAEIVGADEIAYESNDGKLEINISANDPKYPMRRFNVYVNEVPLYGSVGISIAHLKKQVWDTTVSIPLSMGENKIQVAVMNELGLENFKYPTYVNYSPQNELVAKTYYIGIGVNEFKDQEHNLKYCVKDVQDLAMAFAEGNSNVDTLLLTNKEVTRENILKLKEFLSKTSVNDKVIISCSSHGLLDDSLNFYLAMHDVDFKNPKARGLKYEELESLLDGIPARQKLLLLDACNSGENDKTELLNSEIVQLEKQLPTKEITQQIGNIKGAKVKFEEENKNNFKKMNELFVNVRNNTGSVIISAAGGQESALEAIKVDGETIQNGAFTFSILECLEQYQGKELKVNTLKQFAEKRVEEITNGKQKPTSRQETMEVDWRVR